MPEWLIFLFMVAVFVVLAMVVKFPIGIALALSALAGALFAGEGPSLRHLVEGAFGYFDTILIILTATLFIKVLQDAGILDTATALMLRAFYRSKTLLLLAAMVILGFLGTGWAFVAMTNLMGRAGAPRGSVAIYLTPVVAITLGVAFRDETVAGLALVGMVLVLLGAWLTSRSE